MALIKEKLKLFEQLYRRFRCYVSCRDRLSYQSIRQTHLVFSDTESFKPVVVFHFCKLGVDIDGGRYAYLIIKDFIAAGYKVLITDQYKFLATIGRKKYKSLLSDEIFEIVLGGEIPACAHSVVSDSSRFLEHVKKSNENLNTLLVDYSYVRPTQENEVTMPYYPYPRIIDKGLCLNAVEVNEVGRRVRVSFAGRICERTHNRRVLFDQYQMMNRAQVLGCVEEHFSEQTTYLREWHLDEGNLPKATFARPDSGMLLDAVRYVSLLENSDFFLAAPGGVFPIAHNLSEAMLCGAIPILSYADYPIPALKPGRDCLVYRTEEELLEVLKVAAEMSVNDVKMMRESVLNYAREHLEVGSFSRGYLSEVNKHDVVRFFYFHEFVGSGSGRANVYMER